MTDLELLKLAAKSVNGGAWHPITHDTPTESWNPLEDDGDALRLMTEDDFIAEFRALHRYPSASYERNMRRATVRAAAEIGRSMV